MGRWVGPPEAQSKQSQLALACLLVFGAAAAVLLASDAFEFSWRYQLPALVTLPPAGLLGIALVIAALRRNSTAAASPAAAQPAADAQPAAEASPAQPGGPHVPPAGTRTETETGTTATGAQPNGAAPNGAQVRQGEGPQIRK